MKSEKESMIEVLKRRKHLLFKFFKKMGVEISLLGDYQTPLLVTKDNIVLSCYLHNFEVIFKDAPYNGNEIFRVKLKHNISVECYRINFNNWLKEAKHRKVYMFQSGEFYFNKCVPHLDKFYPIYTKSKRLAYYVFSMEKALEVQKNICSFDKKLRIVL